MLFQQTTTFRTFKDEIREGNLTSWWNMVRLSHVPLALRDNGQSSNNHKFMHTHLRLWDCTICLEVMRHASGDPGVA